MPVKTVRWIEMVFGEGLSADEASHKILEELAAEEEASVDNESAAEATDAEDEVTADDESAAEATDEEATDAEDEVIADDEATASEEEE